MSPRFKLNKPKPKEAKALNPLIDEASKGIVHDEHYDVVFPPEKREEFEQALSIGLSVPEACISLNLDFAIIKEFIDNNVNGIKILILRAAIKGKKVHLAKIMSGKRGWQSSAWYLERKFRDEYGKDKAIRNDEPKSSAPGKSHVFKIGDKVIPFN